MNLKKKIKNLSRKEKAVVAFWVVFFIILTFHSLRFPQSELEQNCAEFTRKNGCYMSEEEIVELESGGRLMELVEGTPFEDPKEACGCVTYNITDL